MLYKLFMVLADGGHTNTPIHKVSTVTLVCMRRALMMFLLSAHSPSVARYIMVHGKQ